MKYKFYHPLRVRYVEMDPQQHVLFSQYLNYFDLGLTEYTRAVGYFYPNMVASGYGFLRGSGSPLHPGLRA